MQEFSKWLGEKVACEAFTRAIFQGGKPSAERLCWLETQRETMRDLAEFLDDVVREADPAVRVSLMSSGASQHCTEGRAWQGNHKGLSRGEEILKRIHLPCYIESGFDDWFICPHDGSDGCRCRKPKTGLLDSAVAKYALDRKECLMVGDRESDIACAKNAGMYAALLQKNKDPIRCTPEPDLIIGSLSELLLHFPRLPSEN